MAVGKASQAQGRRLLTKAMYADPYPAYRELRESAPVFWDESLGSWVVTRYDDVSFVLHDARFSSNRIAAANERFQSDRYRPLLEVISHKMSEMDEPDNLRLRTLVNKAFVHVAVEHWEPNIRRRVSGLIDGLRSGGRCEFIRDFAVPLPLLTILELVGVPAEDHQQVKGWCDDFALVALNFYTHLDDDQIERGHAGVAEFRSYIERLVEQAHAKRQDNLLSALASVEQDGRGLTMEELLANVFLLLSAGNETTTCLLANGVLALLRFPDQMEVLRRDHSLVTSAVEEFLRFESPVQYLGRIASEDVEIRSQLIRRGDLVLAVLAAANHDPERFSGPEVLDIRRTENHHLAFGHGRHFCVGSQLARMEARIALEALLEATTQMSLDGISIDELSYQVNFNIRRVDELPLRIDFLR